MKFHVGGVSMEDEHRVHKFRRFIPDRGRENKGLVQFWVKRGGLRTTDVSDIVRIK